MNKGINGIEKNDDFNNGYENTRKWNFTFIVMTTHEDLIRSDFLCGFLMKCFHHMTVNIS